MDLDVVGSTYSQPVIEKQLPKSLEYHVDVHLQSMFLISRILKCYLFHSNTNFNYKGLFRIKPDSLCS